MISWARLCTTSWSLRYTPCHLHPSSWLIGCSRTGLTLQWQLRPARRRHFALHPLHPLYANGVQAWKAHVYPLLEAHLAEQVDSVLSYMLLYHEAAIANLLEVCAGGSHSAEGRGWACMAGDLLLIRSLLM